MRKTNLNNTSNTEHRKRFLSLEDLRGVLTFKSFYIILVIALLGVILILIDTLIFSSSSGASTSPWKGILLALGVTLLTSSTVSLLFEVFMRLDIVDFVMSKLDDILSAYLRNPSLQYSDLLSFQTNRTSIDFDDLCKGASGYLKILGLSANDIISPHTAHLLIHRVVSEHEFYIRILLINPWSIMAQRRSEAPTYGIQQEFFRKVWSALLQIQNVTDNLRVLGMGNTNFEVRFYDTIPSLSMIIDNSKAIVTPLISTKTGGSSPFFIVKNTSSAGSAYALYEQHFDTVWQNADPLSNALLEGLYKQTVQREIDRSNALPQNLKEWLDNRL